MTFELMVICDHRRNDPDSPMPPRTVATIVHVPKPDDGKERMGWLEWRQSDSDSTPALQTFYGEAVRLGTAPRAVEVDAAGEPTVEDFLALRDLVPGMGHAQRWRFHCEDCADTVPARHEKLVVLLDALRHAGGSSVTLAALAPRV